MSKSIFKQLQDVRRKLKQEEERKQALEYVNEPGISLGQRAMRKIEVHGILYGSGTKTFKETYLNVEVPLVPICMKCGRAMIAEDVEKLGEICSFCLYQLNEDGESNDTNNSPKSPT